MVLSLHTWLILSIVCHDCGIWMSGPLNVSMVQTFQCHQYEMSKVPILLTMMTKHGCMVIPVRRHWEEWGFSISVVTVVVQGGHPSPHHQLVRGGCCQPACLVSTVASWGGGGRRWTSLGWEWRASILVAFSFARLALLLLACRVVTAGLVLLIFSQHLSVFVLRRCVHGATCWLTVTHQGHRLVVVVVEVDWAQLPGTVPWWPHGSFSLRSPENNKIICYISCSDLDCLIQPVSFNRIFVQVFEPGPLGKPVFFLFMIKISFKKCFNHRARHFFLQVWLGCIKEVFLWSLDIKEAISDL